MTAIRMAGKPVADKFRAEIAAKVDAAKQQGRQIVLAILTVGQDPASFVYRKRLLGMAEKIGAGTRCVELPEEASTEETLAAIQALNEDPAVTGILPMMPMPPQVDSEAVGAALAPAKDMDCLNPMNGGALLLGQGRRAACTPRACLAILEHYGIELDG